MNSREIQTSVPAPLVQDGEVGVTRRRGKQKYLFWAIDPGLGYVVEDLFYIAYQPF